MEYLEAHHPDDGKSFKLVTADGNNEVETTKDGVLGCL